MSDDFFQRSQILHEQLRGKIGIYNKMPIRNSDDLSLAYTPGVAEPCKQIAENPAAVRSLTLNKMSMK